MGKEAGGNSGGTFPFLVLCSGTAMNHGARCLLCGFTFKLRVRIEMKINRLNVLSP